MQASVFPIGLLQPLPLAPGAHIMSGFFVPPSRPLGSTQLELICLVNKWNGGALLLEASEKPASDKCRAQFYYLPMRSGESERKCSLGHTNNKNLPEPSSPLADTIRERSLNFPQMLVGGK